MTLTQRKDGEAGASYLELVELLQSRGGNTTQDCEQLFRRVLFNIRIHNTDDHLRNHGFFIDEQGIQLSPAYDINPSVNRNELSLAIDETETTCDVSVAMNAYKSYGISTARANEALQAVDAPVSGGEKKQTDSVFQKRRRLLWRKLLSNEELTMRRCKPGNPLSTSSLHRPIHG
jgi:serine/threonine-protein kinase HipA